MTYRSRPPGHDYDYFRRREAQERYAAERAPDPAARRAHETLAINYADRLRAVMPSVG